MDLPRLRLGRGDRLLEEDVVAHRRRLDGWADVVGVLRRHDHGVGQFGLRESLSPRCVHPVRTQPVPLCERSPTYGVGLGDSDDLTLLGVVGQMVGVRVPA